MFVKDENKYKAEVEHTGGIGIGWLAIAIFAGLLFAAPSKTQIDCFVGVQAACQVLTESYVK